MAKLKQNKLVFEREHCLIQVTSKEHIKENNNSGANWPSYPKSIEGCQKRGNLPRILRRDNHEIMSIHGGKTGHAISANEFYRCRSISSSSGSCSSSCSEDDRDKGCLDDWESISDAMNADSDRQTLGADVVTSRDGSQMVSKGQAWSPDDVFRPQSLPRISRQQDILIHFSSVDTVSRDNSTESSVCPICCEDLDMTDSRFLPCPCGFRLCLFCHKTISEVDGRCPGCRKQYGSENTGVLCDPGVPIALSSYQ